MSKSFTIAEVAKHNKQGDIWITIGSKVYDVTTWLDDHPGGVEVLTKLGGKDATYDFEDTGHSDFAYKKAEEFCIGTLKDYDPSKAKAVAKPTDFSARPAENRWKNDLTFYSLVAAALAGTAILYNVMNKNKKLVA